MAERELKLVVKADTGSAAVALNQTLEILGKLKDAGVAVGKAVLGSIQAAAAEETGINRLAGAIDRVGGSYAASKDAIEGFAASQQASTRYGDDQTRRTLEVLVNLTGEFSEQTIEAARVSADLAEAMGMDLDSAARAVAQGLEGNVAMLGRYVPALREMSEESRTAENVLDALNATFQGAASDLSKTEQAMIELRNSVGDLNEEFGAALTQNESFSGTIEELVRLLQDMQKWVAANREEIADAFSIAVLAATAATKALADITFVLIEAFLGWKATLLATIEVIAAFRDVVIPFGDGLAGAREHIVKMKGELEDIAAEHYKLERSFTGLMFSLDEFGSRVALKMGAAADDTEAASKRMQASIASWAQMLGEGEAIVDVPLVGGIHGKEFTFTPEDMFRVRGPGKAKPRVEGKLPLGSEWKQEPGSFELGGSWAGELGESSPLAALLGKGGEGLDAGIDKLGGLTDAMDAMNGAMKEGATNAGLMGKAFESFGSAVMVAFEAVITGKQGFARAMQDMAASVLQSIGAQAAIKAAYEIAEAFADLAGVYTAPMAAGHFAAAAKYAAVAAVGFTAGALVGGIGRSSEKETKGGAVAAGPARGALAAPAPAERSQVTQVYNITVQGAVVGTKRELGRYLGESMREAHRAGMLPALVPV